MISYPLTGYPSDFISANYMDWRINMRVLTVDDTDVLAIPTDERIVLGSPDGRVRTGSREKDNVFTLVVEGTGGAKVTLYSIIPGGADSATPTACYVSEFTTTKDNQQIQFRNLPPLTYVAYVTGVPMGGVRIHGGGTK